MVYFIFYNNKEGLWEAFTQLYFNNEVDKRCRADNKLGLGSFHDEIKNKLMTQHAPIRTTRVVLTYTVQ